MNEEELEKEAEEYLKKKNYTSGHIGYFASGYCKQAYIDSAEPREKRIAELEAQLESERDLSAIAYMQGAEKQKKKDEEQLTKAKELLKQWLSLCGFKVEKLSKDTEQFLSEVEK